MTDLFSNVPLALVCASAGVPLIYSIHTDIAQLDGVNLLPSSAAFLQANAARLASACVTTSPSFMKTLQKRGIRWCDRYYRPLPVCGVVEASEKCAAGEIRATRRELTGDHPERPLLVYVGRWSAEKRMHLLKRCRPSGATLAFVGDGPMREVVERWHDPPRVVVSPGMRKRNDLARVYRAADWVVSASAFETFGNVPYEAAHCGTPALLQDAQGFTDQIDGANEDRGALVKFDSPIPEGEIAVSEAMDRTRVLLSDPDRVRDAARRAARDGVTIAQIVSEVLREEPVAEVRRRIGRFEIPKNPLRRTLAERLRRCERFFFAFLWAIQLAVILTVVKAVMIGCMRVGVDFTTGMAHQRGAKKRRRRGRSPGAAEDSGAPRFSGGGLGERGERRDAKRADAEDAADAADAAPADGEDVLDATLPPSPARVLTRPLQPYV
jgi:glycosyltransferase involved in cell wall biosynthesis